MFCDIKCFVAYFLLILFINNSLDICILPYMIYLRLGQWKKDVLIIHFILKDKCAVSDNLLLDFLRYIHIIINYHTQNLYYDIAGKLIMIYI